MPESKNKRTAAAGGPSKKIKLNDPLAAKFDVIEKAFRQGANLPESLRQQLVEVLPCSLGIRQGERHPFQTEVVNSIGKMLNQTAQGLEGEIVKVQERLEDVHNRENLQRDECAKEKAKLEEKESFTNKRMYELAAVAQEFRRAKGTFLDAKATQEREDAALERTAEKKQQMEAAIKDTITPLSTGQTEGLDTGKMIDGLVLFLNAFEFEESLITALKPALHKAPDDRGDFDLMCFKELNDEISKRITEFESTLSSGEAGKQERAAAVKAAEESFIAAREKQNATADLFTCAQSEQQEVNNMLNTINKALKGLVASKGSINMGLISAKMRLDVFNKGPLATFKELEDMKVIDGSENAMTVNETEAA